MNHMNFLENLQYILPIQNPKYPDNFTAATAKHFKTRHGGTILELLRHIGAIPPSEKHIKKSNLVTTITQINSYIELSHNDFYVWHKKHNLVTISSKKMKKNGMKIYIKEKSEKNINPHDFMIEKKQAPGFDDKCIIGTTFNSLLILFDNLLSQVRNIAKTDNFNLTVARIFSIVDTISQANNFIYAFFYKKELRKGAVQTAKKKQDIKNTVTQITKALGLKPRDASQKNLSETLGRIKKEYKRTQKKDFPYIDKTLEKYTLEAIK